MKVIEDRYRGDPNKIVIEILRKWLTGRGLPLMWQALIKALRDGGLNIVAHIVERYLAE